MKKFYSTVTVVPEQKGYAVALDGRAIKTPGKASLLMPTEALAIAVADEWRAQGEDVDPDAMPLTQLANTAIDRVGARMDDVIEELVAYAHTDLLCYRATDQDELTTKQNEVWQPYLDWLKTTLGVELKVTAGIMPLTQDDAAIDTLRAELRQFDVFTLTAFHAFVAGFGSIVIALALVREFRDFESCWAASHLDETHQEELWGLDWETEEKRSRLKAEMVASLDLWRFVRT